MREKERVDATKGIGSEGTGRWRVRRMKMRMKKRRWRRRRSGSGSARGWRTSSDFSAVAAASERAALLCTSSLMASPVQPWLGSVLYHTAGRVPPTSPFLPPSFPLSPGSAPLPRLLSGALNPLALSLLVSLSRPVLSSSSHGQWRKGERFSLLRGGFETFAFFQHNVVHRRACVCIKC